jgi:tRNA-dihydrouridine synthase 2
VWFKARTNVCMHVCLHLWYARFRLCICDSCDQPTADQAPEPVVLQVGTGDAVSALQAALVVAQDICAFDVNMGCPVQFSVQGGMGSALLNKPETVRDILTTLRRNLPSELPVTCKIRILRDERKTLELVKIIESCGVAALAIHARHVPDRPRWRALTEKIAPLAEHMTVPLIYNGDCFQFDDIARLKIQTGASSIMIARGAMWNPSVFQVLAHVACALQ